jgi:hypothetical protein
MMIPVIFPFQFWDRLCVLGRELSIWNWEVLWELLGERGRLYGAGEDGWETVVLGRGHWREVVLGHLQGSEQRESVANSVEAEA